MTSRQKIFLNEYLLSGNATQAALKAGYSRRTARFIAAENLSKPIIRKAIEDFQQAMKERTEVTVESIIQGIQDIATNEQAKNADRLKAYELLGKHLGLFKASQPEAPGGISITINESGLDKPHA